MNVTARIRSGAMGDAGAAQSRRSRPESSPAGRILVVDDEPAILRAMRRILQGSYRVDTALGAVAAASLLAANRYEAVVSDYSMPEYDGIWLLAQVRRTHPRALRVLVSGSGAELFSPHVRSGLVQRFVAKPADPEEIIGSLKL